MEESSRSRDPLISDFDSTLDEIVMDEKRSKSRENKKRKRMENENKIVFKRDLSCSQCDYKTAKRGSLNHHNMSKHNASFVSCEVCDFAATTTVGLKQHVEAKHENIRYDCNICDYRAIQKNHLKQH